MQRWWGKLNALIGNTAPYQIAGGSLTSGNHAAIQTYANNPDILIVQATGTWACSGGLNVQMSPNGSTWTTIGNIPSASTTAIKVQFCPAFPLYQVVPSAGTWTSGTAVVSIKQNGDLKAALLGDSTFCGVDGVNSYPTGSDTSSGCQPFSAAVLLSKLFADAVTPPTPSSVDSFFNDSGQAVNSGSLSSYDTRITYGAGWTYPGGFFSVNGSIIFNTTDTTSVFSFTPAQSFDCFHISCFSLFSGGTGYTGKLQIKVNGSTTGFTSYYNGVALTNNIIDGTATGPWSATQVNRITVICTSNQNGGTAGSTAITFVPTANGSYGPQIMHVDCFLSTSSRIRFWNWGQSGSAIGRQTDTNCWNGGNNSPTYVLGPSGVMCAVYAPDIVVANQTINNMGGDNTNSGAAPFNLTSYLVNYQNMITEVLNSGASMVLVTGFPPNSSSAAANPVSATMAQYIAANYQLAKSKKIMLLDQFNRWGSWVNSNNQGLMASNYHATIQGYWDQARFIYENLRFQ